LGIHQKLLYSLPEFIQIQKKGNNFYEGLFSKINFWEKVNLLFGGKSRKTIKIENYSQGMQSNFKIKPTPHLKKCDLI